MKRAIAAAWAGVVVAALAGVSVAAPLPAGGTLSPVPSERSPYAGGAERPVALLDVVPAAPGGFVGRVRSVVVPDDRSNPFGGLTFTYSVYNDSPAGGPAVTRLVVPGFAGAQADVSELTRATVVPFAAVRSAGGDEVAFDYAAAPLGPGLIVPRAASDNLVVQTGAADFRQATAVLYGGDVVLGTASVYVPVPEPASAALLSAGGLLALRRRRRAARNSCGTRPLPA
jgi:hypothetical protein